MLLTEPVEIITDTLTLAGSAVDIRDKDFGADNALPDEPHGKNCLLWQGSNDRSLNGDEDREVCGSNGNDRILFGHYTDRNGSIDGSSNDGFRGNSNNILTRNGGMLGNDSDHQLCRFEKCSGAFDGLSNSTHSGTQRIGMVWVAGSWAGIDLATGLVRPVMAELSPGAISCNAQDERAVNAAAFDWLGKPDSAAAWSAKALGVLDMPGRNAWTALGTIGRLEASETAVMGAVSGQVGSLAGEPTRLASWRLLDAVGDRANDCGAHGTFESLVNSGRLSGQPAVLTLL
jgi:hypothetical protein